MAKAVFTTVMEQNECLYVSLGKRNAGRIRKCIAPWNKKGNRKKIKKINRPAFYLFIRFVQHVCPASAYYFFSKIQLFLVVGTTVDYINTNVPFLFFIDTNTPCSFCLEAQSVGTRLGASRWAQHCSQLKQQGGSSNCIHIKNCIAFLTTPDLRYISSPAAFVSGICSF